MNPMRMSRLPGAFTSQSTSAPTQGSAAEIPGRRVFLKVTAAAAGGLTLGIFSVDPALAATAKAGKTAASGPEFAPNAFLRIAPDSSVTVIVKHLEMGQGTYTGLPTLVAEELDAAWSQVKVEGAPADAKLYNNLQWGPMQGTGGSSSMATSFGPYRLAGAAARAMLVGAAAARWKVSADAIAVSN
ncbi:MAG: molybdopterin cofactor-binding domain-containing protein, partial [Casimicrobiaceae bacterium]